MTSKIKRTNTNNKRKKPLKKVSTTKKAPVKKKASTTKKAPVKKKASTTKKTTVKKNTSNNKKEMLVQRPNFTPKIIIIKQTHNKLTNNNINKIKYGFSPLTGYESRYEPNKWNNNTKIRENHNCYSYAFNDIHSKRTGKAQPGYYANYPPIGPSEYNCDAIYKRIKKDNPSVYKAKFTDKCGKGYYKSFFALSLDRDTDYHFYRQDKNGFWSHKPGRTNATNLDASKKIIINPLKANRNYSHLNYSTPCTFFCVHPGMTKTHSTTKSKRY